MTSPTPPTTPATTTTTTTTTPSPITSASRTPDPARPEGPDGALFDAIATEHGVIYGYGLVSAHSTRTSTTSCRRPCGPIANNARRASPD